MRYVIVVVVLIGCAHTSVRPVMIAAPDNALARASRVMADRGETIEMRDDTAGVLLTRWRNRDSETRLRWKISIDGARLSVASQCQEFVHDNFGDGGKWEWCENPDDWSDDAKAIALEIGSAPVPVN